MDAKDEVMSLLERIWLKLQELPNANPVELGAFLTILTFILLVLAVMLWICLSSCTSCCRNNRKDAVHDSPTME